MRKNTRTVIHYIEAVPDAEPVPPPSDEMTIEQLAAAADLPFTTIRMYQHRGLLPPPERRGRVGYYNADHLARLRLIAQLQDRGYSLAAIKDLVDTWQSGRSLDDVLRVERQAASVLGSTEELRLRPEELAARFAGIELDPAVLMKAQELGLITIDGGEIVVRSLVFLDVGTELVSMGVPPDEVLDEYAHLREAAGELAERFSGVFERNLWQPFVEAGMPPDEMARLTAALERLGPLAEAIVTATLRQALAAVAARFLDEQAKALSEPAGRRRQAARRPARARTGGASGAGRGGGASGASGAGRGGGDGKRTATGKGRAAGSGRGGGTT